MSFRASVASRGICTSPGRDRSAATRPFSIHDASRTTWGQHSAVVAERPFSVLPKLRGSACAAVHKSNSNCNGNSIARGGTETRRTAFRVEMAARCEALSIHDSKRTTLGSAFRRCRRRGLAGSSAPPRSSAPRRETTLRDEACPRLRGPGPLYRDDRDSSTPGLRPSARNDKGSGLRPSARNDIVRAFGPPLGMTASGSPRVPRPAVHRERTNR